MDELIRICLVLVIVFPIVGAIVAALAPWSARSKFHLALAACGVSVTTAVIAAGIILLGYAKQDESVAVINWLNIGGAFPVFVQIGFRVDVLSAILLAVAGIVTLLVMIEVVSVEIDRSSGSTKSCLVLAHWGAMAALLLSTNFLQVLLCWYLLAWFPFLINSLSAESAPESTAAQRMVLATRSGDLLFAAGIFLIWSQFGTLSIATVTSEAAITDVLARNPAAVSLICICLFAGAAARCAQFPLLGWVESLSPGRRSSTVLVQTAGMMPAAVFVLIRCAPLFQAAPVASTLVMFVGALTAALAAIVAISQRDLITQLSHATSAHLGLIFLAVASGNEIALAAGTLHLAALCLLRAAQFLIVEQLKPETDRDLMLPKQNEASGRATHQDAAPLSWSFLVLTLTLTCGLLGQNGILMAAISSADAAVEQSAATRQLAYGLAIFGFVATAFAGFRTYFLTFHAGSSRQSVHTAASFPPASFCILILALAGIVVLQVQSGVEALLGRDAESAALHLVLVLMSAVFAWMIYGRAHAERNNLASVLEPFQRLGSRRFYLDDILFLGVVLPTRGVATLCRFLDWFLVDAVLVGVPLKIFGSLARLAEPMREVSGQFQAAALLLTTAVLTAVFLWLQG